MALVMPYMCDAEKTSAVMVFCEAKGFGGDDDVELLWEPWRKGLLDRFEGLVLLGLGLPAMSSFVVTVLRRRSWGQRDAAGRDQRGEQRQQTTASSRKRRVWHRLRGLGVKQLRNAVVRTSQVAGARERQAPGAMLEGRAMAGGAKSDARRDGCDGGVRGRGLI
jgi:hypothetical protein